MKITPKDLEKGRLDSIVKEVTEGLEVIENLLSILKDREQTPESVWLPLKLRAEDLIILLAPLIETFSRDLDSIDCSLVAVSIITARLLKARGDIVDGIRSTN